VQVCFRVGTEESEGEQTGLDGVGDGKGRRRGHTMTVILFSLEDDEPYEWLDCKLNNICGSWAVNQGLVPLAIKCGDLSLPGLCSTLQFFIDHKLASEVLIETQLRILLNEAERM